MDWYYYCVTHTHSFNNLFLCLSALNLSCRNHPPSKVNPPTLDNPPFVPLVTKIYESVHLCFLKNHPKWVTELINSLGECLQIVSPQTSLTLSLFLKPQLSFIAVCSGHHAWQINQQIWSSNNTFEPSAATLGLVCLISHSAMWLEELYLVEAGNGASCSGCRACWVFAKQGIISDFQADDIIFDFHWLGKKNMLDITWKIRL